MPARTHQRPITIAVAMLLSGLAGAAPAAHALRGSCKFSGPIEPTPPITGIPRPGSHFSYQGRGTCDGTLDAAKLHGAPISVTFTNVATAFDTCELGPDVNLTGIMSLQAGVTVARFVITIDLSRLALAGPFTLTTAGGGEAAGTATFQPDSPATAPAQCASSGVSKASLAGSFDIVSALVGADASAVTRAHHPRRHHHRRRRTRKPGRRTRSRA